MVAQVEERSQDVSRKTLHTVGVVAVFAGLSALYLLFVIHYSVDELYADEWQVVPLIHAALHDHFSLSAFWAQDGENRMLVLNVAIVVLGVATHDNPRADVVASALINIAAFGAVPALCRSSLLRSGITATFVLVTGVVWFGLEDWQNVLFGFQLAWYLIVLLLVVMLWPLLSNQTAAFVLALLCAFVASYSSFQGLELWPIGVICLLWTGV